SPVAGLASMAYIIQCKPHHYMSMKAETRTRVHLSGARPNRRWEWPRNIAFGAEFLLRQAGIGKYMIVETHSDLVVRRVMRAVMAEELRQEAVRLYFTRVDTESEHYRERGVASSVLERVEIDERGQIQNWPTGFMDDDIRESRRLLDIMYGTPGDVEGEEEAAR
ncbi:MAG: DUF3696 domain-containing protein, partial [Isosphaeraceae bacterium]